MRKSSAKADGSTMRFACRWPGAKPGVGELNVFVRDARRILWPALNEDDDIDVEIEAEVMTEAADILHTGR